MCVLAWIIWRRDGRDVPFEDIIDGTVDFDLMEMLTSMAEAGGGRAGRGGAAGPYATVGPGWHTFDRHRYLAIFAREFHIRAVGDRAPRTSKTSKR